jgi:hypothetical protein
MNKIVLVLAATLLAAVLAAQAPDWDWAVQGGSTGTDYAMDICTDAAGNSFVVGYFSGTATFGAYTLASAGGTDVFIAKLDPQGNYLWVSPAGGTSNESGLDIAIGASGDIYVTGYFFGTINFNIWVTPLTAVGQCDVFIAKLDVEGTWLWAQKAGGSYYDQGYSLCVDSAGNCYATGYFTGTATFGGTTLTGLASYGDIWVAKLDGLGNWQWAVEAGGDDQDRAYGISQDASGNCYVCGSFSGTASFGTYSLTSEGMTDAFVARIDGSGVWQWVVRGGGLFADYANAIAVDAAGNSVITGSLVSEEANFGPYTLIGDGWALDCFTAKLDSSGSFLWASWAGSYGYDDEGQAVALDADGNAYITGYFEQTAYFGTLSLTSLNAGDVFVSKLDNLGNFLWAERAGSNAILGDKGLGIAVTQDIHILAAGGFSETADFGPNNLTANALADAFVARLTEGGSVQPPGMPVLLSPADGAANLSIDGFDLDWESGTQSRSTESYVVYLASDLSGLYSQHQWPTSSTSFNPVTEGGMIFAYNQVWYWTVKAINLDGETIAVPPFSFTIQSGMVVSTFPATWDFENPTFPPDGFAVHDGDGSGTTWTEDVWQNTTPGGSKSAAHYASIDGYQYGALVLPAVLMPIGSFMTLSFQHRSELLGNYEYCGLMANTSPEPLDPGWTEIWNATSVHDSWTRVCVDITAFTGQNTWFAFRYEGGYANHWYLDDISIYEVEPVATLPAVWDFEGTEFPPTGWSAQDNDGQPTSWAQDLEYNHTTGGLKSAVHRYSTLWEGEYGQDGWLIARRSYCRNSATPW